MMSPYNHLTLTPRTQALYVPRKEIEKKYSSFRTPKTEPSSSLPNSEMRKNKDDKRNVDLLKQIAEHEGDEEEGDKSEELDFEADNLHSPTMAGEGTPGLSGKLG